MITRLGMAPRLDGMTYEQFQHHWRTAHADAAGKIPNLKRYVQNHAVLRDGAPIFGFPGFDACSELDFESVDAMEEGFASTEYMTNVKKDERSFVEKSRFSSIVGDRLVLTDGLRASGGVKLMQFHRSHPRSNAAELRKVLESFSSANLLSAGIVRREILLPIELNLTTLDRPASDAVDSCWFKTEQDALSFVKSGLFDRQCWELSGITFGGSRHLATEVDVVLPK